MNGKILKTAIVSALFSMLIGACRDPFEPDLTDADLNFLVVEGFIDTSGAASEIYLSRTSPIRSADEPRRESGATLRLLSQTGEVWPFFENSTGEYRLNTELDNNHTYQLEILLRDGSQFLSKPMRPIISPEIDEVGFTRDEFGVEIYLSTQGNDEAEYFLWEYEEHWIFKSGVITFLKFENGKVLDRKEEERIDRCWNSNLFPKIILQNAARFENNTILQRELVRIPNFSEKLTQRYSIEIKQRAIDQEAYDYWEILRKNSDDIGGIFSPLPSFLNSNLEPLDGTELDVIGHISMGQPAFKRLYINYSEVDPWRVFIPEYEYCYVNPDTILLDDAADAFRSGNIVPARLIMDGMFLIGYHSAPRHCTDCTIRGSRKAPDFWED